jgi:hypothetical protein
MTLERIQGAATFLSPSAFRAAHFLFREVRATGMSPLLVSRALCFVIALAIKYRPQKTKPIYGSRLPVQMPLSFSASS